ncbi:MAG: Prepilin peptidase [Rickettsiales bacterium]|jgi:leader peptidase (prepilin peptidase)/N-methyltransferase|nr:Prepilin peptidase [Rickettsiales bacterium]
MLEIIEASWIKNALFPMFGLLLGSFITAVSYRLPKGEDIIRARSRCPGCGHTLTVLDLVPVFSWIFSLGKCRHCAKRISIRYPLIEVITALYFLGVYHYSLSTGGITLQTAMLLGLGVCLMMFLVMDIEYRFISDPLLMVTLYIGLAYGLIAGTPTLFDMLIGGLTAGGIGYAIRLFLIWWKGAEALRMGEVKFLLVAGIYLGYASLPVFFLATLILGLALKLVSSIRKKSFSLIPALAVALLGVLLFRF